MEEVSPKISIRSTLITTYGLEHNEYSGIFTNVVLLDDLFESEWRDYLYTFTGVFYENRPKSLKKED